MTLAFIMPGSNKLMGDDEIVWLGLSNLNAKWFEKKIA
jgi:hypothetical protein